MEEKNDEIYIDREPGAWNQRASPAWITQVGCK